MECLAFTCKIKRNKTFAKEIRLKKEALVNEAISWEGNTQKGKLIYHDLWESSNKRFKVSLGKYGKEYYLNTVQWKNGNKGNNPNDMKPTVYIDGNEYIFDGSFDHVFHYFQEVYKYNEKALEILGCLMCRNAFLVDHISVNGHFTYVPPTEAILYLQNTLPPIEGIEIETYLHYLDAIAWNEDTKYYTLGYDIHSGIGRKNNMLTYAHIIAVLLGKASLAKLCSSFSRPPIGVSAISFDTASTAFPSLKIQ